MDQYGKEKERYCNRNEWGIEAEEIREGEVGKLEKDFWRREKDIQKQIEESKLRETKYDRTYREQVLEKEKERPRYLRKKNLGKRKGIGIRALVKLRCGNLEEGNKYWLEKEKRMCRFCEKGSDNLELYRRVRNSKRLVREPREGCEREDE